MQSQKWQNDLYSSPRQWHMYSYRNLWSQWELNGDGIEMTLLQPWRVVGWYSVILSRIWYCLHILLGDEGQCPKCELGNHFYGTLTTRLFTNYEDFSFILQMQWMWNEHYEDQWMGDTPVGRTWDRCVFLTQISGTTVITGGPWRCFRLLDMMTVPPLDLINVGVAFYQVYTYPSQWPCGFQGQKDFCTCCGDKRALLADAWHLCL